MAKNILMEELHLTVYVPPKLTKAQYDAIRRALNGKQFRDALDQAVADLVRRYPSLNKTRFTLTR